MVFSLYEISFCLLGVLVALMLFSLSINCEQHISLFIIHEHIVIYLNFCWQIHVKVV